MAAVVNVLRFKEPVDPGLFHRAQDELGEAMRAIAGFQGLHIVQTSDTEVILIILGTSTHVLDRIATEVGSPWMIAHVLPHLSASPQRHIGEEIASVTS